MQLSLAPLALFKVGSCMRSQILLLLFEQITYNKVRCAVTAHLTALHEGLLELAKGYRNMPFVKENLINHQ